MADNATKNRRTKRSVARRRATQRRAAAWKRATRRAVTLALAAGLFLGPLTAANAQMGQTAMTPAAGLVNGGLQRFQNLSDNGPGWMYYGINAADRGLGYRGSYMTLGGFIPTGEDDLGGFWAADLRSHLSEYGGFFSNVGAVRKQFIGGTLLGVGVYWDYDGDQNQYSDTPIPVGMGNVYSFAGGQTYNQVGVSGEWLTDWGNLRSNGYIPVGSTAQLVGPFLGNAILCQNGVNAALGGADLEVGAYIPGLSDWAGMVSVGGYALGNTRYKFPDGSAAVPWFGGVYTRLDMTFIKNWDFSLQANNDSYFDWTGFARLTYRMGGSRRRSVSDQVEQPMVRNEHIVRARQVPEVAISRTTGNPFQVFHVDNSAAPGGSGTAEAPFATLEEAQAAAVTAYDIVYVHVGNSVEQPYFTPAGGYTFANTNQYLIGEGSSLSLPTLSCGERQFFVGNGSGLYPRVSNPLGAAITVNQPGTQVNHLRITGSLVGISDAGTSGLPEPGRASVDDVIIQGVPGLAARGIEITQSTGAFDLSNIRLADLSAGGVAVTSAATVNLEKSSLLNIGGVGVLASGAGAKVNVSGSRLQGTTGNAVESSGASASIVITSSTIANTAGNAVVASGPSSRVDVSSSQIAGTSGSALITAPGGTGSVIVTSGVKIIASGSTAPAIDLQGVGSSISLVDTQVDGTGGVGARVQAANSTFTMQRSRMANIGSDGISVESPDAFARVLAGSSISGAVDNGIVSTGGAVQVVESTIDGVGASGIRAVDVVGSTTNANAAGRRAVWVQGATIRNAEIAGIEVTDSDLRVERADPASTRSRQSTISNTGDDGIVAIANKPGPFAVLVDSASISGVDNGVRVAANGTAGVPTINFTARNNAISTNAAGAGINVSAEWDVNPPPFPGEPSSRVNAAMVGNNISTAGTDDILLTTVGGPLQSPVPGGGVILTPNAVRPISIAAGSIGNLEGLNNGANVSDEPAGIVPGININFNPGLVVPPPPSAPPAP